MKLVPPLFENCKLESGTACPRERPSATRVKKPVDGVDGPRKQTRAPSFLPLASPAGSLAGKAEIGFAQSQSPHPQITKGGGTERG